MNLVFNINTYITVLKSVHLTERYTFQCSDISHLLVLDTKYHLLMLTATVQLLQ